MGNEAVHPGGGAQLIDLAGLDALIGALAADGYRVIGPRLGDGAIIYDEIGGVDQLPIGWTEVQDGGLYRLERRTDRAVFGFAVGPHSWKKFLHAPVLRLWRAQRQPGGSVKVES